MTLKKYNVHSIKEDTVQIGNLHTSQLNRYTSYLPMVVTQVIIKLFST